MPDIHITQSHTLGLAAAKKLAEKMADQLGKEYGLNGTWNGDSIKFARPGVDGLLSVTDKAIDLQVTLGFLLKAMKGPIEKAVTTNMEKLFAQPPAEEKPAAKKAATKATAKPAAKSVTKAAASAAKKKSG
jgi:putative polyhydroxyalkanoate system protein